MLKTKSHRITIAGMLIAAGIILPFATSHGLGMQGNVLLPMHIPVYIIGFLCGPLYGFFCGLIIPVLSSLLTGMPPLFPMLPLMRGELATYGLISGLLLNKTKLSTTKLGIYPALLGAMLGGRMVYGVIFQILMLMNGSLKALSVSAAFVTGIPGIIIQLILVPCVITAICHNHQEDMEDVLESAKNLIAEDTVTCVIIKNNRIVKTEYGRGIAPIIAMYESGILDGAFVVDKIIGKAAAMILIHGNAKGCYGSTISEAAISCLKENGVNVSYGLKIELIQNREGNGICPMEQTIKDIDNPKEALAALKAKLEELRANKSS